MQKESPYWYKWTNNMDKFVLALHINNAMEKLRCGPFLNDLESFVKWYNNHYSFSSKLNFENSPSRIDPNW